MIVNAKGTSRWAGNWKEGAGTLSTDNPTVSEAPYSYASRFEGAPGAVPEQLLAASYAGCLNQAFANTFSWGNFTAEFIETEVEIEVEFGYGSNLGRIHITTTAKVPGLREDQYEAFTQTAKKGCLISRLLNIEATMDATLVP
jgi:osmotically inducible protein OsmC